jgi:hypothetical protein
MFVQDVDTFNVQPNLSERPISQGGMVAFSNSGDYLAFGHSTDPKLYVYKKNGAS